MGSKHRHWNRSAGSSVRYENRQAPEGINVSKVNPFAQFLKLLVSAAVLIILLVILLQIFGGALAKRIPFKYEVQLMDKLDLQLSDVPPSAQIVVYLNNLAARLESQLPLSEDKQVRVHYYNEPVFNAFATMGGNLFFYRGLLEQMPSENALAMVMAHEMAHINHRDPITSVGGGVASMIAVSMVTGDTGFAGNVLTNAGVVTGTQFTRRMETAADTAALKAVYGLYGHVNGASSLFEVMGDVKSDNKAVPDWLERFAATHPLSNDRVDAVAQMAQRNGWSVEGELTPLPEAFLDWLETDPAE